jgi:hypothetical protein
MWPSPLEIALVLAVVGFFVARAHARVDDKRLAEWARARGLGLTAENRPIVARYIRSARVLRTWGAVGGAFLPSVIELALTGRVQILGFGTDGSSAPYAGPIGAYVGYLVGALYAEVSLARPVDPARRAASLVPRELADYLPHRLLRAQRTLAIGVVLGVIVLGVVPYDPRHAAEPTWLSLLTGAAMVAAFAAGLEAIERWLVQRPQPFTTPSLVAADDAIRGQSVHSLAGSGLALLLIASSGVFVGLAASDVPVLRWTMWLPALVTFLLSVRACLDIGHQAWRVRRPAAGPTGAAST